MHIDGRKYLKTNYGRRYIKKQAQKIILKTISPGEVKHDMPHYGLKEHASFRARGLSRPAAVDVQSGFVLATTLTPASASSP